jgi:branched-chain amino acid transport system permease protein
MADLIQVVFDGLSVASFYALVAIGVTLIFGLTGIVNFAQGQLLMLGAFVTWGVAEAGVNFFVALLAGAVAMGALGAALELGLFRQTLRRPITGFIVSLGLIPIFEVVAVKIWGTDTHSLFPPLTETWTVGGAFFPSQRVFVILVTAAVIAALFAVLRFTHTGRSLRATSEDREMARLLGVRVPGLVLLTFVVGSAIAGLAGGLVVSTLPITPYTGANYVFLGFAVALLGGLGSVNGAVLAALILGIGESFVARYLSSSAADAYILTLMIAILLARPQGLLRGTGGSSVT